MNRIPFVVSAIAVAVLAGCATGTESGITAAPGPAVVVAPAAPAPMVVVPQASPATMVIAPAAVALRVGFGRVESIQVVPGTAAAGGTAPTPSKRITMRMDDGTAQYFDTNNAAVVVGDRIEITANGTMRHPA